MVGNTVCAESQMYWTSRVLAVVINASLFTRSARWRPALSGDFANGVETVVANHVVSHVWKHTYLLWFDDELTPQLRRLKTTCRGRTGFGKVGNRRAECLAVGWQSLARSGPQPGRPNSGRHRPIE